MITRDSSRDSSGVPTGWFADLTDLVDDPSQGQWEPVLQTSGLCLELPIAFNSKVECERFIRDCVLDRGMLDDVHGGP